MSDATPGIGVLGTIPVASLPEALAEAMKDIAAASRERFEPVAMMLNVTGKNGLAFMWQWNGVDLAGFAINRTPADV